MKVWLITAGEQLPIDINNPRLMRTGIFAHLLAENGHEVTWWSSTFNHTTKQFRFTENTKIALYKNLQLNLLHGKGYTLNLSIDRIINHYQVAKNFRKISYTEQKPDIIIASFPTPDLAKSAVDFGKKFNIPVLIDVRDLWPEAFLEFFPPFLKPIGRILLAPLYNQVSNILKNASGLISITKPFLDISLNKIRQPLRPTDGVFAFGYKKNTEPISDNDERIKKLESLLIKDDSIFKLCFFGTLSHQFDIDTIINAAKVLETKHMLVRFIICGEGDKLQYYKTKAKNLSNIIFTGFIGSYQIKYIMSISNVGLAPYIVNENFTNNFPNKIIEYFSEALPVLTCLTGHIQNSLKENNCGFFYENGNTQSLVELIETLLSKPDLLQSASENALALYERAFEADKVYTKYMNHVEKVVENHKNNNNE